MAAVARETPFLPLERFERWADATLPAECPDAAHTTPRAASTSTTCTSHEALSSESWGADVVATVTRLAPDNAKLTIVEVAPKLPAIEMEGVKWAAGCRLYLEVDMSRRGLTDDKVGAWCASFRSLMARNTGLKMFFNVRRPVISFLDFSCNKIGDRGAHDLLKLLLELGLGTRVLKLHKNLLGRGASAALAKYMRQSPVAIEEMHLSHNQMDLKCASILLDAVADATLQDGKLRYPVPSASGTYKPLWLRLEKNVIENCGSLVSEAMERNLLHARARSTGDPPCTSWKSTPLICTVWQKCNPNTCCYGKDIIGPLVHLPHIDNQSLAAQPSEGWRHAAGHHPSSPTYAEGEQDADSFRQPWGNWHGCAEWTGASPTRELLVAPPPPPLPPPHPSSRADNRAGDNKWTSRARSQSQKRADDNGWAPTLRLPSSPRWSAPPPRPRSPSQKRADNNGWDPRPRSPSQKRADNNGWDDWRRWRSSESAPVGQEAEWRAAGWIDRTSSPRRQHDVVESTKGTSVWDSGSFHIQRERDMGALVSKNIACDDDYLCPQRRQDCWEPPKHTLVRKECNFPPQDFAEPAKKIPLPTFTIEAPRMCPSMVYPPYAPYASGEPPYDTLCLGRTNGSFTPRRQRDCAAPASEAVPSTATTVWAGGSFSIQRGTLVGEPGKSPYLYQ